jgi:hypothetical protein
MAYGRNVTVSVTFGWTLSVGVVVGFVRTVIDVSDLEHDAGQNILFVHLVVVEHVCEVDEGCIGAQVTVGQIPGDRDDILDDRVLIQDHLLGAFSEIVKAVRDKLRWKGKLLRGRVECRRDTTLGHWRRIPGTSTCSVSFSCEELARNKERERNEKAESYVESRKGILAQSRPFTAKH